MQGYAVPWLHLMGELSPKVTEGEKPVSQNLHKFGGYVISPSVKTCGFATFLLAVACCLQPATSPRESFGFQRGAAESRQSRDFGAFRQRKARLRLIVFWLHLMGELSPKVTEGEKPIDRCTNSVFAA